MKRLRLAICTLLFIVSIFGALSTFSVLAQVAGQDKMTTTDPAPPTTPAPNAIPPNATPQTSTAPATTPGSCSLSWTGFSLFDCINGAIAWIIKNTLLQIAGFLLWASANMFNYSVQIGVLQFAKWVPVQIYPIWLIVRQIVSLIIIFIGLYLGFMYILGKDEKFQKYIPWVVMFALFVNFSYPITRTMVDISNVVSLNIYASAVGPSALTAGITDQDTAGGIITARLGLTKLIAGAVSGDAAKDGPDMLKSVTSIPAALAAVVFVVYAAYIFLIVTGIFLMRTFLLVLLIVGSPLLLVDGVFPLLGEKAKMLRKVFFEQLIVGPVFMIMFALTLKFLTIFSTDGPMGANFNNISAVATGDSGADTIKTFFNLIMMLVMLHVMIKVTKSTAGTAGNFFSDALGTVGSYAVGAATGGVAAGSGLLARKGIGGAATAMRDSKWVTNNQDSFIGRRAYNLSNSVANSTFDIRNTAVAQKASGKLGISMGMGAKMGYDEESKATIEKKKKDAIDARNRIKTHYERDKYKENVFGKKVLDENGQAILLHKKGEVNEAALAAQRRFDTTSGGALFQTKKQKEAVDDALTETMTAGNEKIKGEIEKESSIDMSKYSSLKTKEEKANFVNSLNSHLTELKKTDKDATGKQAKAVVKTLEDIKKKETDEKNAFDKQVQYVLTNYTKKTGADKEKYLSNQSQEINEAVTRMITDEKQAAKTAAASPLDLDVTAGSSEPTQSDIAAGSTLRQERIQKVAEGRAKQVENSTDDIFPELYEADLKKAQEKQQESAKRAVEFSKNKNQSTSSSPVEAAQPFNVEQVATVDFAQQAAARRAERQQEATQKAQSQMAQNAAAVTNPVPGVTIPSPTVSAPTTPASNQTPFTTTGTDPIS